MKLQNQYPIIFLTLKDMIENNYTAQIEKFASLIGDVIKKNPELLESKYIDETDRHILKKLRNRDSSLIDLKESLYRISQCMQQHYHQNVI
ncbi:hypothetical protein, partial [Thomasclavelia sp.]|uniref:hypothetical protein n=1 Tax=Thomasclavelia sp. TaxID=3025757 RepID=UPI0025FD9809